MELESRSEALRRRGLGLAAISYDSEEILRDFASRRRITFPLLSDAGSKIIRAFGLLNDADYPAGRVEHGVPHPGTFVADASGVVLRKDFEPRYQERRTAASYLDLSGDATGAVVQELRTDHFALRLRPSNTSVAPGNRLTLTLDFEMRPGRHAYAPGAKGYRPLRLQLDPQPHLTIHAPVYPTSRPHRFVPLDETVPVFAGRFRVTQDVTLADGRALAELLKSPEPRIDLTGALEYQVCSETTCFAPSSLPLRASLTVLPLDRERSPEAIRHKPPSR